MGNIDLWEEAGEAYVDNRGEKPFWTLPLASKDENDLKLVHRWLMGEVEYLKHVNRERFSLCHKNLALYKGIQYRDQELRQGNRERIDDKTRAVEKIVLNHLFDLSKSRISKLLKYKPAVAIMPTNDEWEDQVSAKMTKFWLDHIWYVERFDGVVMPKFVRYIQPMGEAYLFIDWDPDKGDIAKQYKEAMQFAQAQGNDRVPLMDEDGNQELDDNGNLIYIESPVYNGDIGYRVKMTTDVLVQRVPTAQWEDVDYIFERDIMEVEEARLKWPKAAKFIQNDVGAYLYDYEKMEARQDKRQVEVWTMYHRRCRKLEKGRKVVFTKDGVLSSTEFPFTHKKLPCIRLTDIDIPGELHGMSFFELVKGSTGAHNNLTNMILRNQIFVGHPKWMMPAGSAKLDSLGNAITVVQYKGPTPPQLVSSSPTPAEVFKFRDLLKQEFMQQADVGMTGRGDPPAGITAAVALQYLSELENERWNESILKYNEAILQSAIMTIADAGDYYDDNDDRMIRVLGKNNAWMSIAFKSAHLQKDYDVRIQSSSALPESKAARTEYLLYLNERFPNRVDADSVLNMLDLAQSDKFVNTATVSVRSAETENEMMMDAREEEEVAPPTEEEDQLQHWRAHVRKMREWAFKNATPEYVQARFKDHLLATEMLIAKKALSNPGFAKVAEQLSLEGFPILLQMQPQVQPESAEPQMEMPPEGMAPYNMPIQGGEMQVPEQMPVDANVGEPVNVNPMTVEEQLYGQVPPVSDQAGGPVPPLSPTRGI